MEFLQSHDTNQLGPWTPLIGGFHHYVDFNLKISEFYPNK